MGLRITIDIFSGRQNPVIELEGKEAKQALDRLAPVRKLSLGWESTFTWAKSRHCRQRNEKCSYAAERGNDCLELIQ